MCSGAASTKGENGKPFSWAPDGPKTAEQKFAVGTDIRNSHWNVLCCSPPHRVADMVLQCVQNYSAHASPPKCKMENAVYYQRYLLGLIRYDTYICNMFPSVRSSVDGLGNSI